MAKYKLDEIDHQILDLLIDNTRTPFTDIAKQLDISAGTVHVRVRKMEEIGIIKDIAAGAVGFAVIPVSVVLGIIYYPYILKLF